MPEENEGGRGGMKWQEVEPASDASTLESTLGEPASSCGEAPLLGSTKGLHRSGRPIPVSVSRKSQGRSVGDMGWSSPLVMADFHEPQDFEDFTTTEEGLGALVEEAVAAGVAQGLQLPGTAMPPFSHTETILQKRAPEWFPRPMTVKDIINQAAQTIGLNLNILDHNNLEAAARFFANPTMLAAILITTAVLELQEQQLTLNVEVQVIGNVAQGRIDYLIKGPQRSLPIKMVETADIFTSANQGQLLAQMSAVRDQEAANPNQDTFGVLTNGQEWGLYRFEEETNSVRYEVYELSVLEEWEVFLAHLEKLLAALVGILRYQAGAMGEGGRDWAVWADRDIHSAYSEAPKDPTGVRHVLFSETMNEPRSFSAFSSEESIDAGMEALLRGAGTPGAYPVLHEEGDAVPLYNFGSKERRGAVLNWLGSCLDTQDPTVEDLINRAVESIGAIPCLLAMIGRTEESNQVFVDVIMSTAMLITASLMKLEIGELALVPKAYISGKMAQGWVDNLIKFRGRQVGVVSMLAKSWTIYAPEYIGQLLAQMSALRDDAEASTEHASAESCTSSRMRKHDVFGILSNGDEWAFFRFQHGSPNVHYETHQLRVKLGQKPDRLADQVEQLLSAVVGIMFHQVQRRQEGYPVKSKRSGQDGGAVKRAHSGQ